MSRAALAGPVRKAAVALIVAGAVVCALSEASRAQESDAAARGAVAQALSCRAETDSDARLSCLDEALERLAAAYPSLAQQALDGPVVALDDGRRQREGTDIQVAGSRSDTASREAQFGAEDLPQSSGGGETRRELREITSTAISTSRTARGALVFVLENGQVWRQLQSDTANPSVPDGDAPYPVTIRSGFLGSHFLKIADERPAVRVRRIR